MKQRFSQRQVQWFMCIVVFGVMEVHAATTRVWTGNGTNALASTPENWAGDTAPANGDHIRFDDSHLGNAWTNATWNLEIEPASWTQTVAYAGTATIQTKYPGQGSSFTNLTINGDVTLEGGAWTHESNPHTHEVYRLAVTVDGDFTLGSNAVINLTEKGYANYGASGCGPGGASRYVGSSYGGLGSGASWDKVYGSVTSPTNLGSSSYNSPGGGALLLNVGQTATIHGEIGANGGPGSNSGAGSSGGSIFLAVGELAGTGVLEASGSGRWNLRNGGGGRIAVHLKNSDAFGAVRMCAYGGNQSAAAGTIYRQTSTQSEGEGTLVIDNNGCGSFNAMTMLPPDAPNLDHFSGIILTNSGWLALNTDTVFDWANPANLSVYGPMNSALTVLNTNWTELPSSYVLTGVSLHVYTNLSFSGNLTISNASMIMVYQTDGSTASLAVGNDLRIETDGTLGHRSDGGNEAYRLILAAGNDLDIATNGRIMANGAGFGRAAGPGKGVIGGNGTSAASHGGQGGQKWNSPGLPYTYGSILQPVRFGSGAENTGGGAIQATVQGATRLLGTISATPGTASGLSGGAGGSVWLTTGQLEGDGTIDVSARIWNTTTGQYGGGGGRIAVYVTNANDIGDVTLKAFAGNMTYHNAPLPGAAGTAYAQTAGDEPGYGILTVDTYNQRWGSDVQSETNITTQLPPATEWPEEDLSHATLQIKRLARVSLTGDLTMGDLFIRDEGARLHLNGHTLRLRSPYHADWGTEDNVVYDGGEILWTRRGTLFFFR